MFLEWFAFLSVLSSASLAHNCPSSFRDIEKCIPREPHSNFTITQQDLHPAYRLNNTLQCVDQSAYVRPVLTVCRHSNDGVAYDSSDCLTIFVVPQDCACGNPRSGKICGVLLSSVPAYTTAIRQCFELFYKTVVVEHCWVEPRLGVGQLCVRHAH